MTTKKSPPRFPMLFVYLIIIGLIAISVLLFGLLYSGSGAKMLEMSPTNLQANEQLPAATDTNLNPSAQASSTDLAQGQAASSSPVNPLASRKGRLIPYLDNGLWGYKNTGGEIVIAPAYASAMEFYEEDVSFAQQNGLYGLIDRSGNWKAEPKWTNVLPFSEGRAAVEYDAKWGFINTDGELVIDYLFREAGSFHCGRAMARSASNYSYIDIQGNVAISAKWRAAGDFSEDVAFVTSAEYEKDRYYIISKIGEKIATLGSSAQGTAFSEGFAVINDSDTCYYINQYGKNAFQETYAAARAFSGGYAAVRKDGLWGYINDRGVLVIEPKFADAGEFSNGLAAAKDASTGLWGYVDIDGDWAISPAYSEAGDFLDGVAVAFDGTTHYILNKSGDTKLLY